MYNRVILMGRLTRDPELRTTQSGIQMCRFSIAVDRSFARQGEERQTDFFDITVWRQQADFVCKYFRTAIRSIGPRSLQTVLISAATSVQTMQAAAITAAAMAAVTTAEEATPTAAVIPMEHRSSSTSSPHRHRLRRQQSTRHRSRSSLAT